MKWRVQRKSCPEGFWPRKVKWKIKIEKDRKVTDGFSQVFYCLGLSLWFSLWNNGKGGEVEGEWREYENYCKGEGKEKEWKYEGNADEKGMGGGGVKGRRESCTSRCRCTSNGWVSIWLVGQCVYVKVVQYYCFYVCFFAIEWI